MCRGGGDDVDEAERKEDALSCSSDERQLLVEAVQHTPGIAGSQRASKEGAGALQRRRSALYKDPNPTD